MAPVLQAAHTRTESYGGILGQGRETCRMGERRSHRSLLGLVCGENLTENEFG